MVQQNKICLAFYIRSGLRNRFMSKCLHNFPSTESTPLLKQCHKVVFMTLNIIIFLYSSTTILYCVYSFGNPNGTETELVVIPRSLQGRLQTHMSVEQELQYIIHLLNCNFVDIYEQL